MCRDEINHKKNNIITLNNNNVKYYTNLAEQCAKDATNSAKKALSYVDDAEECLKSCQDLKKILKDEVLQLVDEHSENCENPHNVDAEQVGAYLKIEVDNLLDEKLAEKNPNLVAGANISILDNDDGTQTITSENTVLSDYNLFENKPSINNISLLGNKTSQDLGLASLSDLPINVSELQNDSGYLTEHQSLDGYATEQWVENQNYLTEHQDISNLATKGELPTKTSQLTNDSGFITSIPSEYVTETELDSKGYLTEHQSLDGYATEQWVENQNYLTEHQDISNLATKGELPTKTSQLTNDSGFIASIPSEYVTETELDSKGYLTSIPSEYVTETELNSKGYATTTELNGGLSSKQDELTTTQLSAVNSGITSAKVTTYDGYATSKANASTAVTHTANTAVGNSGRAVYVNSSGAVVACSKPLNVANATTSSNQKLYLVGAVAQEGFADTASNPDVFIDTDNCLNANTPNATDNSTKVATTAFVQNIVGNIESLLEEI